MRFGAHIRLDKGLIASLDRAKELGCEAVQLFSGNPNSWARKPLDQGLAVQFAEKAASFDIHPVILHTPYLLNLASPDDDIWGKSVDSLSDAVSRASMMNAAFVVTHIGSRKEMSYESGVCRIQEAVKRALDTAESPQIALELSAGAGRYIGSKFEELADIMDGLGYAAARTGICFDTAHAWGAGYDISTAEGVERTFADMKKYIGFDKLLVVHLNDTLMGLGSRRDRHHHIGEGNIGREGFKAIVNYPGIENLPGIIETPGHDIEHDKINLGILKGL